jgi:protocatechuate 3,4-dioxygenase beta subunit
MPQRSNTWMAKRLALLCTVSLTVVALSAPSARQPPQPEQLRQEQPGNQLGRGAVRRPQRDLNQPLPTGTASLSGRVVAGDSGRPVKRARVIALGGGRPLSTTTDEQGRYRLTNLPAAAYNITATKAGFVDAAYGQRRALRAGTPVRLADGQQLEHVDLKLPRGGVITGRLGDEDGEPLARAVVSVMRYQYVRGERQLMSAGADQTDDRGQYRVFGLPPGEYYISARGGGLDEMMRRVLEPGAPPPGEPVESLGYAPTYYPGAISASDATRVKLNLGQEVAGIDFQVQLVALATVRGVVNGGNAVVLLMPEGGTIGGGGRGGGRGGLADIANVLLRGSQPLRATTQADGTFTIRNVAPGTYTIVARSDSGSGSPRTAMETVVVMGVDVQVALTPVPGVSLSGAVTLEKTTETLPKDFGGFRVSPSPIGAAIALPRGGRGSAPNERGEFTIDNVMPGRYQLRATGPRGWTMKSVYVDGRDVTDEAIEIHGTPVSGVNVIFTDRIAAIAGTVRDGRAGAAGHVSVIVFAEDERLWYPQSRHIAAARTDANGAYRVAGLPPGRYLAIAVEDVEPGEWFDPAFLDEIKGGATRLALGEGEQKTQDLRAPSSPADPSRPS